MSRQPADRHCLTFYDETGATGEGRVHVPQSHFHDVAPATGLGICSIWINRLGEPAGDPPPTHELRDLALPPATLDELVPA